MKGQDVARFPCDECGIIRRVRGQQYYKGKMLCASCFRKVAPMMPMTNYNAFQSLETALSKVRKVSVRVNKSQNSLSAYINCPQILIGHKVRLVLADKEKKAS